MATEENIAPNCERRVDPVVAEVRAVRDALAAQFDYDLDRIVQHVSEWKAEQRPRQNGPRGRAQPW